MRLNTEHSRLQDILCEEYAVVDIVVHILTVYVRKDIIICIILLYYSNKKNYSNLEHSSKVTLTLLIFNDFCGFLTN